jgi:hypothetical protein
VAVLFSQSTGMGHPPFFVQSAYRAQPTHPLSSM